MRVPGLSVVSFSHRNMELLGVNDLFSRYRSAHTQPQTIMEGSQLLKEDVEVSNGVQSGSLPGSPGLGVSGANPRLVNGEAGAVSDDVQRSSSSSESVLKKVLTVSEAELLQSREVEGEGMPGGDGGTVNGLSVQLESIQVSETDNETKVC